jgi:hypothetical protein
MQEWKTKEIGAIQFGRLHAGELDIAQITGKSEKHDRTLMTRCIKGKSMGNFDT